MAHDCRTVRRLADLESGNQEHETDGLAFSASSELCVQDAQSGQDVSVHSDCVPHLRLVTERFPVSARGRPGPMR